MQSHHTDQQNQEAMRGYTDLMSILLPSKQCYVACPFSILLNTARNCWYQPKLQLIITRVFAVQFPCENRKMLEEGGWGMVRSDGICFLNFQVGVIWILSKRHQRNQENVSMLYLECFPLNSNPKVRNRYIYTHMYTYFYICIIYIFKIMTLSW